MSHKLYSEFSDMGARFEEMKEDFSWVKENSCFRTFHPLHEEVWKLANKVVRFT